MAARRKSKAEKQAIAVYVQWETTLTLKQIVERLQLGQPRSASLRRHQAMQRPTDPAPAQGDLPL